MTHVDLAKAMAAVVKDYVHQSVDALRGEAVAVRERVAILESRPPLPGLQGDKGADGLPGERGPEGPEGLPGRDGRDGLPGVPGLPGEKGIDGLHGKDGVDGLGFEDLDLSIEGDRTLVFRFANGDREKTFRVTAPWPVYQKNWIQGKAYVPGDVVTWDGSQWQCLEATDVGLPGVSTAWYRTVTKGRAGAPGRDGKDWAPPPVVKVGGVR